MIFDISGEPRLVFPNATAGGHPRVGQFASPFHPNVASTPAGNNEISISRKIHKNVLRVNYSKKKVLVSLVLIFKKTAKLKFFSKVELNSLMKKHKKTIFFLLVILV